MNSLSEQCICIPSGKIVAVEKKKLFLFPLARGINSPLVARLVDPSETLGGLSHFVVFADQDIPGNEVNLDRHVRDGFSGPEDLYALLSQA